MRVLLSLLFAVTSSLAFVLMLIVMAFEVGTLFAATIGLGLGTFIFGLIELPEPREGIVFKKTGDYDPNPDPCCHKVDYIDGSQTFPVKQPVKQ